MLCSHPTEAFYMHSQPKGQWERGPVGNKKQQKLNFKDQSLLFKIALDHF